jgi:superfamily II DNA or RNA helicase
MKLTPLQVSAIKFAHSKDRVLIRMSPGKGKTLVAYSLFMLKKKDPGVQRMAVIASKRGMDSFNRSNFYSMKVCYVTSKNVGTYVENPSLLAEYDVVVIINTGIAKYYSLWSQFLPTCQVLTIDEIHDYRTQGKTAEALYSLTRNWKGYRIGMTATLVYKNNEDIWGVFRFIYDRLLGSYWNFMERYVVTEKKTIKAYTRRMTPQGMAKILEDRQIIERKGYKNVPELFAKIAPYCFVEGSSDFKINYRNVEYVLSGSEEENYEGIVQGLGLEKLYTFRIKSADGLDVQFVALSETESFLSTSNSLLYASCVKLGSKVVWNQREYEVTKVSDEPSAGEYTKRLAPLRTFLSGIDQKYELLRQEVLKGGCIIYCAFQETLFRVSERLAQDFPLRKVVALTGGDAHLESKVSQLGKDDIVVMTKVATQSLDFYCQRAILYENISTPGQFQQFIGRITRENAPFREVEVVSIMGKLTIEQYFFERLVYLIEQSPYEDLKELIHTTLTPAQVGVITKKQHNELEALKECLLWRRKAKRIFKS